MGMTKKGAMRYITRIDSGSTHCYWVRIGYGIKEKVQKSFPDVRHGGQVKALFAAKKWRNQQLKELLPVMAKAYGYDQNEQRHWGTGVHEQWDTKGEWQYLSIVATYWDGEKGKQLHKNWSVNKYGYDKAIALAKQWRKLKITGEL